MSNLKDLIFSGIPAERVSAIEAMGEQLKLAVGLVARLRGPMGCPWDREQDHLTLRPYLIEEAYEVLDVLDSFQRSGDPKELSRETPRESSVPANGAFPGEDRMRLREELGDLLLQVVLHAQLCWERGEFHVGDVGEAMAAKLVSRHPHVFGDVKVEGADEVLVNWEAIKKNEAGRQAGSKGLLSGLPKSLPSLQRAARIGEKAHRVGFDWKDWKGSWEKVEEELRELRYAIDEKKSSRVEHELGDLFFALCNLARHLGMQPEDAHRKAIARFERRFARLERICADEAIEIQSAPLAKLDGIWERVKKEMPEE